MLSINLKNFETERGFEYSVNLNVVKTKFKDSMFISVTMVDDDIQDYTAIFNGLPTLKDLKSACGRDEEAAKLIIQRLKEKDVVEYAKEYWDFLETDEWFDGLDSVLEKYLKQFE